jgi:hypothetical protein
MKQTFITKIKQLINENSYSATFKDQQFSLVDHTEESIVGTLRGAAPQYGVTYVDYEEGIITFSTYTKRSVEIFCNYLDGCDDVTSYAVTVALTNGIDKSTYVDDAFDFDLQGESQFTQFFIDVIITPEIVNYSDYYVDDNSVDDEGDEYFVYDIDQDSDDISDDQLDYFTSGEDVLPITKTVSPDNVPLLVKLSDSTSHSTFGKYNITVHPEDKSKILIQCNYSETPDEDDVEADLHDLNTGNFGDSFKDKFSLILPAKYNEGTNSTTSAIYKAKSGKDAINLIECIDHIDTIKYDILLSELTRRVKVDFHGKRKVKMQCAPGFKYDPVRMTCTKITGAELAMSRLAHKQMVRTKNSKGQSYKRRIIFRDKRALRFRKMMGI